MLTPLVSAAVRVALASLIALAAVFSGLVVLVRQPTFGSRSFSTGPRADAGTLARHVAILTGPACPRNPRNAQGLELAAAYIADNLARAGARVEEQRYRAGGTSCCNVLGQMGPAAGPVVVVGAHYDAAGDTPGADDNASGVAGLLELARLLGARSLAGPVLLVAFSTEEPPYFGGAEMGSAVHARSLRREDREVAAMLTLEMIGFFTAEQPSQAVLLDLAYPRRGDFVAVVGRWQDRAVAREVKRAFSGATPVPVVSWSGPASLGGDLSDHRNYWAEGYSAVMITDTAYLRNPNYHTGADTPETLDYASMAGVVDGVLAAVVDLATRAARHQASSKNAAASAHSVSHS